MHSDIKKNTFSAKRNFSLDFIFNSYFGFLIKGNSTTFFVTPE